MNGITRTKLVAISLAKFPIMSVRGLRRLPDRVGKTYTVDQAGQYTIFRETVNRRVRGDVPIVLVIGFRLKLIGSKPLWHWLFQRVCILTTPFWCGLKGFKIKLWMVDRKTKNYMGIYEWLGEENARAYIDFLIPILRFFSIPSTIWQKTHSNTTVDDSLRRIEVG